MIRLIVPALLIASWILPAMASTDDSRARKIMEMVENRDDGDRMVSTVHMLLIDKNGNRREKRLISYTRDYGKDTRKILFVDNPVEIRNTGFLSYDYDGSAKDDDQWLYLPAIGKTKRIASRDKSSSFMGSDLNYSDMTSLETDDYNYKLVKETKIDGHKVWIIQSTPKTAKVREETGYKKSILAVRQDNYVVIKAKKWTSEGGYVKYMDVRKLARIDGIWVSVEILITKKQGDVIKHRTLIQKSDVKFGQDLRDDMFSIRRLEKGM
jgi:hypothetical protein